MKILIFTNNADGLLSFRLELLQRFVADGCEVIVSAPQDHSVSAVQVLVAEGCYYERTPMNRRGINPFQDLGLVRNYQKIISETHPDIILTYTIKPNIYGNFVANKMKIPVITNITGLGSSLIGSRLSPLVKQLYKFACHKAELVFFQNKGNLDFFIESDLVDAHKIRLIPGSGVNLNKFWPMPRNTKHDQTIRFLFIARIMKDKGIEEYLDCAREIKTKFPNTEFQIIGSFEEGKYRDEVENNYYVNYLGRTDDIREYIRNIDCIIHPSYHEGMSNVLLEGAAMGKPLLASNIHGCKEIIDDGVNGFLFEPKSVTSMVKAIERFLALDEGQRLEMGKNSRLKVEREFDRNIVVDAYLKAIQEIIDGK